MKKNEETCEISENFSGVWLHTQNPRRFAGFAVVVVTVFDEIRDDFHDFFWECMCSPSKINNPFGGLTVFQMKSYNVHWT